MNSNDDVFHVLRQILAGIFLVGVLGFSIYQGVVFWKMWKTRREHPRVTEQEKQKKEDFSTEKNNIPAKVQNMPAAPLPESAPRTDRNKFQERQEQKKIRKRPQKKIRKRPQKTTSPHSESRKKNGGVPAEKVSESDRIKARCRKNLVNWGRQWFIALRRGLPGNELWKDKIFCPTGSACQLGHWKNYYSRPDKRKYMILFYCPAHNWAFCGDGKIRKCKEKK